VGCYQGAVLPAVVFFLLSVRVCVDSEAWGVTGCGVCA